MNKIILFVILLFSTLHLNAQKGEKIINSHSVKLNVNRIADDVFVAIELDVRRDVFKWNQGKFHLGLSSEYGISLVGNNNPQITSSKTSYWQYLQGIIGHRFLFFNERLSLHTNVEFGPINFQQKARLKDSSLGIDKTYKYNKTQFTVNSHFGFGYRISDSWNIELLGNLPIDSSNLSPKGMSLGINFKI